MVRLTDAARIDEGKSKKKSRAALCAEVTCSECRIRRWPVGPGCVGCISRRVVARRRARGAA